MEENEEYCNTHSNLNEKKVDLYFDIQNFVFMLSKINKMLNGNLSNWTQN